MFFFLLIILVLPYFLHVDIFGIYLDVTAGAISRFLLPV